MQKCEQPCHKCIETYDITFAGLPYNATHMILCEKCGNKRCPHASDHNLACTKSNEPGQPGSIYKKS